MELGVARMAVVERDEAGEGLTVVVLPCLFHGAQISVHVVGLSENVFKSFISTVAVQSV